MATLKLKLQTKTDMFGTKAILSSRDGKHTFDIGENIPFDPLVKLSRKMDSGYLFRSPDADVADLSQIWETIEGFTGKSCLSVEYDDKEESLTAYLRIEEKGDATMFAFSHNTFEKWSDEKTKESKKKVKKPKLKVGKDGSVKVKVSVETLGD